VRLWSMNRLLDLFFTVDCLINQSFDWLIAESKTSCCLVSTLFCNKIIQTSRVQLHNAMNFRLKVMCASGMCRILFTEKW